MTRRKVFCGTYVAAGVVSFLMFLVCVIFYFVFFEKPYLKYTNLPLPTLKSSVHAGEVMPIHVARCNSDSVTHVYTLARTLERVDTHGNPRDYILMRDMKASIRPGCFEEDSVMHIVPSETPKGIWRLIGTSDIQGVLVHHIVEWYSVPFEVN